jgi:Domain of unknown function (DUF4337)
MAEQKPEQKPLSRSEREAQIKDKAGWVITVIACLLAATTYISNNFSSRAMTNLIKANDTYSFYQAKSIKQSIAEGQLEDAKDPKRREELKAKIDRYESDPVKGEGKRELLAKAKALEAERDEAKLHSPWLTFAGMALQFAIVLLSASILAVSTKMFKWSIAVSVFGAVLLSQGIWLWLPLSL